MENSRKGCDIGSITSTTLLTTSYTPAGSAVPFYLQPTLGGADFPRASTLFADSSTTAFCAPNRLLTQVDFDKAVANLGVKGHPIGQYGLYGFFDAGNVSATPSRLTAQRLRTDVGIGVSIAIQNKLVLRAYLAFGAGEGSHINAKAANTFALTPPVHRLVDPLRMKFLSRSMDFSAARLSGRKLPRNESKIQFNRSSRNTLASRIKKIDAAPPLSPSRSAFKDQGSSAHVGCSPITAQPASSDCAAFPEDPERHHYRSTIRTWAEVDRSCFSDKAVKDPASPHW